ncbi:MAG TPA: hypothetical protein VN578_10405 [Candidatus Binatia bacterium]|jgi:hypothetical protein|nr:hypothetical protein [Candidatus Binatia bacterium]
MSTIKQKKQLGWGGVRSGAGHPETGITKEKVCISVDKENWNTAKRRWKDKPSRLVDGLVLSYVKAGKRVIEMGAAT